MRATDPTTAAKEVSKISVAGGGTPLATAAFKPMAVPTHAAGPSVRAGNAPLAHVASSVAPPHMIHPNSGVGVPTSGSPRVVHVPGVKNA